MLSIHIQLERFEGPLGLLLHLIRKEEMDIFDINIHQITGQYLEYIKAMKKLDLEVAGEFVAMAATLIHIKSRMLLPQYNESGEEIEGEDPRQELVQKLLEYQKFQDVAKRLSSRNWVGRDVWLRGTRFAFEAENDDGIILEDANPLFALISAYRQALKAMKHGVHKVVAPLQSIAARIMEIKDRLLVGQKVLFRDLITATENRSSQVLVTFLSMLELAKMGFISLFQAEAYADIHIESKRVIDRDVLARVESYEGENAAQVAEALMADAMAESLAEPYLETSIEVRSLGGEEAEAYVEMASDEEILAEEQRLDSLDHEV